MPFPMVSLTVFVVFANAPPMGLDAFEGDEVEEEDVEVEPPPAAPLDGCAGPIKALSEEGPVLGIYLL